MKLENDCFVVRKGKRAQVVELLARIEEKYETLACLRASLKTERIPIKRTVLQLKIDSQRKHLDQLFETSSTLISDWREDWLIYAKFSDAVLERHFERTRAESVELKPAATLIPLPSVRRAEKKKLRFVPPQVVAASIPILAMAGKILAVATVFGACAGG